MTHDDPGMTQQKKSFTARGGLWVLAQVPLLLLAFVIPMKFGAGDIVPRDLLQIAGVTITVSGVLLALWGLVSLGDALTPFPAPLVDATLRGHGAYKLMRHPIYSGVMLASLGWALWWLSVAGAIYALVLVIFFDRKAAYEEVWLRQKYTNYPDYARAVKKFIPGLY